MTASNFSALLLDASVKATLIVGLAAFVSAILTRRPAAERALLWTLVMVALLVLPPLSIIVPPWRLSLPFRITIQETFPNTATVAVVSERTVPPTLDTPA